MWIFVYNLFIHTCKALVNRILLLFNVANSISHFLAFAELKINWLFRCVGSSSIKFTVQAQYKSNTTQEHSYTFVLTPASVDHSRIWVVQLLEFLLKNLWTMNHVAVAAAVVIAAVAHFSTHLKLCFGEMDFQVWPSHLDLGQYSVQCFHFVTLTNDR